MLVYSYSDLSSRETCISPKIGNLGRRKLNRFQTKDIHNLKHILYSFIQSYPKDHKFSQTGMHKLNTSHLKIFVSNFHDLVWL